jgi:hypothetical protein
MGDDTLRSEIASSVLIEVEEIFSPNLNEGQSILWSVSWFNGPDSCLTVKYEERKDIVLVCSICR